jgi:hypothetical protein
MESAGRLKDHIWHEIWSEKSVPLFREPKSKRHYPHIWINPLCNYTHVQNERSYEPWRDHEIQKCSTSWHGVGDSVLRHNNMATIHARFLENAVEVVEWRSRVSRQEEKTLYILKIMRSSSLGLWEKQRSAATLKFSAGSPFDGGSTFSEKKNRTREQLMFCCPENDLRLSNVEDQRHLFHVCFWIPCYSVRNRTFGSQWDLPVCQKPRPGSICSKDCAPSRKSSLPRYVVEPSPFPETIDYDLRDYGGV